MTSTESVQVVKRGSESAKKSPLKVVSPIIKKYSGHRQGKIKKKLKFGRILHGGRKQKKQMKPLLKTILPKTNAGDVIVLEPELFPCALNPQKKLREDEMEGRSESVSEEAPAGKSSDISPSKDCSGRVNKSKLLASNKKKVKCLKSIEASLELLESNASALKEKREQAFVENYLARVQERLKENDESIYNHFTDLICNFQANGLTVCDLYKKIKMLFHSHVDLCEDFVAFLTPEQAVECGVFMEHLLLNTMSDFLNMIDIYFSKSPQQIRKIHSVLQSLVLKSNVTTEYVMDTVLPLLKGNPVLRDYFLQLLPEARPPDNLLTDFEKVEYPELNSDVSDEDEVMEVAHLPEVEDPYGGEACPCKCHDTEDVKLRSRSDHCIPCSLKFINGKIFIQQGKLLKPARVVFADNDTKFHRDRLTPKLYPKRNRKRHRHSLIKDNLSPTKSCNLSSDEFKSDVEDEEKVRLKFATSKSPRTSRKKSLSPKHCEKILPRCILGDQKAEPESEGKCLFNKHLDLGFREEEKITNGTKMESNENLKSEPQVDMIRIFSDAKEEPTWSSAAGAPHLSELSEPKWSSAAGALPSSELSKADVARSPESPGDPLSRIWLNDSSKNGAKQGSKIRESESDLLLNKEGSHSPPVISIPETATPLFNQGKPMLSILEKLEDSKDSLLNSEESVINAEESPVAGMGVKEEPKSEESPWKIEEDRVILQTLQVEENCEETFVKIGKSIPARSVENIKKRFEELMNIFFEMKAKTGNS